MESRTLERILSAALLIGGLAVLAWLTVWTRSLPCEEYAHWPASDVPFRCTQAAPDNRGK